MPEMPAAAAAMHLGTAHEQGLVDRSADSIRERLPEARPAGAALIFRVRGEQRQVAAGASEDAFALFGVERTAAGTLGAMLAQHVILRRREQAAPFFVTLFDLEFCGRRGIA